MFTWAATNLTLHDTARDRAVPVRLYVPTTLTEPAPLIVFSHGLGGTREGYRYLGEAWAARGFIVAHVQHPGSDISIFNGPGSPHEKALRAVQNLEHSHNRPQDIRFALDELTRDPRVDCSAIGVAGHSFGAHTALALVGMTVEGQSYRDERVRAALTMSAPRPAKPAALAAVTAPCLHLTGTHDDSPIFPHMAVDRAYCFHHTTATDQWLLVLPEAHHFTFSDNPVWAGKRIERDPAHQPYIAELGAQFFAAYLRGQAEPKEWLARQPGMERK